MVVAVGPPIFVWDWPTCCKVFSILAPVPQTSLVPPAIVTNKNIQCFSKAAHSWKTIGSLFLIRDRPVGVPGMQWRMVGPGLGRHWLGQNVRTWRFSPANQGQDGNMAKGAAQQSAVTLACFFSGPPREDGGA